MKKLLLTLIALFTIIHLFAQKIEVSVQANSGLFHFGGRSAVANSSINQGSAIGATDSYTNNPYGSRNAFSYSIGAQAQTVSKSGFIAGLQAGYELLRSKVDIDYYSAVEVLSPSIKPENRNFSATGSTNLQMQSINLNPYVGYRILLQKVKLDILPGIDIGLNLSTYDKGTIKDDDDKVYAINRDRGKTPTDWRLRLGLAATYDKFGITASYARGLTNYGSGYIGGSGLSVHSELVRFGLTYQIF